MQHRTPDVPQSNDWFPPSTTATVGDVFDRRQLADGTIGESCRTFPAEPFALQLRNDLESRKFQGSTMLVLLAEAVPHTR